MSGSARQWDDLVGYCRRLGHPLRFSYCRTTSGNTPCPRVLDCWHERFDVVALLRRHGPSGAIEALRAPSPPKLVSLLELVEQAKRNTVSTT